MTPKAMSARYTFLHSSNSHPLGSSGGGGGEITPKTQVHPDSSKDSVAQQDPFALQQGSDDCWDSYLSTIKAIISQNQPRKKERKMDVTKVHEYLLSKSCLVPSPPSPLLYTTATTTTTATIISDSNSKNQFQQDIIDQRHKFNEVYNFTRMQYEYGTRTLIRVGDYCARHGLSRPIVVAWQKMLEAGMTPNEQCYTTFMYALGVEEEKEDNPTTTMLQNHIMAQVATMHDLLHDPNERTVSLRIKNLIANNQVEQAEALLQSLSSNTPQQQQQQQGGKKKVHQQANSDEQRLRTYLPILEHFCAIGDAKSILRLWTDMRTRPGVYMDENVCAMMMGSLARSGCFAPNAAPLENGVERSGLLHTAGPALFNDLATIMSEDLLELSADSVKRLQDDIMEGFHLSITNGTIGNTGNIENATDHPIIGRVTIDRETGLCPLTGAKLRLFTLNEQRRQHVHDTLLEMARFNFQEYTGQPKGGEDSDYGFLQLSNFSKWLDTRDGPPFTAIVDGANVGYYGYSELHYSQVNHVFQNLKSMGENPLIIIPKKYTFRTFLPTGSKIPHKLSDRDISVMQSLESTGNLFVTPGRCHDDFYWMLASVSNQTNARKSCNLKVPIENTEGRFPGLRPILVTNDKMRDHRLRLLEDREFRRWLSCHIVNYNISSTAPASEEWTSNPRISFVPADFYSREIQGNPSRDGRCTAWHFPVSEWDRNELFCVCIGTSDV